MKERKGMSQKTRLKKGNGGKGKRKEEKKRELLRREYYSNKIRDNERRTLQKKIGTKESIQAG